MCKKLISILYGILAFIYIIAFFPAITFIAPLGLLATVYSSMSTTGAILCFLGTSIPPLSMPFSSYFICVRVAEKKYGKAFFYCLLPFLCALGAFCWCMFIVSLHTFFE